MVGVDFQHLKQVDIFDLLGLNPFGKVDLKELRKAYRRVLIVAHPDRTGQSVKAKQLSELREFLSNFDTNCRQAELRLAELTRNGIYGWVSTWNPWLNPSNPNFWKPIPAYIYRSGCAHVPRPIPTRNLAKPGSSLSNPIVIDAPEIGAPAPLAVGSLNRKRKFRTRAKSRRQCRNHRRSEYHPSRASKWLPAPYADQSDTDPGWSSDSDMAVSQ